MLVASAIMDPGCVRIRCNETGLLDNCGAPRGHCKTEDFALHSDSLGLARQAQRQTDLEA